MSNVLPKELSVVINDLSADMPTHILVVYSVKSPLPPNAGSRSSRCTTLFLHLTVNLPILQSSAPAMPKSAGESISIPIVSLHFCTGGFPPTFHLPLPQALKRWCRVWVAATSDEVHSTQGLLEVQGDSQRL